MAGCASPMPACPRCLTLTLRRLLTFLRCSVATLLRCYVLTLLHAQTHAHTRTHAQTQRRSYGVTLFQHRGQAGMGEAQPTTRGSTTTGPQSRVRAAQRSTMGPAAPYPCPMHPAGRAIRPARVPVLSLRREVHSRDGTMETDRGRYSRCAAGVAATPPTSNETPYGDGVPAAIAAGAASGEPCPVGV